MTSHAFHALHLRKGFSAPLFITESGTANLFLCVCVSAQVSAPSATATETIQFWSPSIHQRVIMLRGFSSSKIRHFSFWSAWMWFVSCFILFLRQRQTFSTFSKAERGSGKKLINEIGRLSRKLFARAMHKDDKARMMFTVSVALYFNSFKFFFLLSSSDAGGRTIQSENRSGRMEPRAVCRVPEGARFV